MARVWRMADPHKVQGFLVVDDDTGFHVTEDGVHEISGDPLAHAPAATPLHDIPGAARVVANNLYRCRPGADEDAEPSEPPIL